MLCFCEMSQETQAKYAQLLEFLLAWFCVEFLKTEVPTHE